MRYFRFTRAGLIATALLLGCGDSTTPLQSSRPSDADPKSTVAAGFTGTTVARGNAGVVDVNSQAAGYNVQIKATSNTDLTVANVVVVPGGTSGWHSHPGPVLIIVKTGTLKFYRPIPGHSGCSSEVYNAGSAYIEEGGDVGVLRNEGSIDGTLTVVFFAPAGAATRIDQPAPGGNCDH